MNLWQLRLHRRARELERLLERPALRRVINCLLGQPELGQQLRARLPAQRHRPRVRHLLRRVDPAVALGDADRIVPHVVRAVHVDRALPVVGLDVVPLRVLELALRLQLLRQVQVRLGEQILAVLPDQPDHVLVVPVLLVHVDCEVRLVHHQ
eukprot:3934609-Rhodomonas_salina.2